MKKYYAIQGQRVLGGEGYSYSINEVSPMFGEDERDPIPGYFEFIAQTAFWFKTRAEAKKP